MTTRHELARRVLAEAERRAGDATAKDPSSHPAATPGSRQRADPEQVEAAGADRAPDACHDAAPGAVDAAGRAGSDHQPDDVIRRIVLDRLALRDHTRAQLEEVLRRKGAAAPAVARVLDRMGAAGLIDDDAYATAFVSSRHGGRGWGRARLSNELRVRGVDPQTTESALAGITPADEREQAQQVAMRRLPQLRGLPAETARRRLAGLLARRGYAADVVYEVVAIAMARREPGDE